MNRTGGKPWLSASDEWIEGCASAPEMSSFRR